MSASDWTLMQARQILFDGDIGCAEYVQELLRQIHRTRELQAWTDMDPDLLLRAARRTDQLGHCLNPGLLLAGLPVALKDNINTRALPTTGGTAASLGYVTAQDAVVSARLWREGALLSGKTNMHELALGITNNNAVTGAARNPWNPEMIAGGSSGGSAVAVAARMVPAALGTDTGGSVRLPAALCGVVGFRPTVGRYSMQGVVPLSHTRDTVGSMARTVADVQLLDQVLSVQPDFPVDELPSLRGVRLGVPGALYEAMQPDVQACLQGVLGDLQRSGAELVEVDLTEVLALNDEVGFPVVLYELVQDLSDYLRASGCGLTLRDVAERIGSPDVAALVRTQLGPAAVPRHVYETALHQRQFLIQAYAQHFAAGRLDALVFPTSRLTARPIGEDVTVELNGVQVPTFATYIHNTDPGSNAGLPGISLPAGLASDGMPVGLELDGPAGSDQHLLALAQAVETILPSMPTPMR